MTPISSGMPSTRISSWITAEDLSKIILSIDRRLIIETATGRILRCEVFVDWIKTIEIETTTRLISKDDIELLQIRAFDAEGGLSFEF